MTKLWLILVLLQFLLISSGCITPAKVATRSTSGVDDISLNIIKKFSDDSIGFTMPVTFISENGTTITRNLLIDTGSAGLYVIASELESLGLSEQESFQRGFGGGAVLNVKAAKSTIMLGNVKTQGPIKIGLIESIQCSPQKPNCQYKNGVSDLSNHGYFGIIGIGLRNGNNSVFSPMAQLGQNLNSFQVSGCEKNLIIQPSVEKLNGFKFVNLKVSAVSAQLPNGATSWDDRSIPVLYKIQGSLVSNGPRSTMLDTGIQKPLLAKDIAQDWIAGSFLKPNLNIEVTVPDVISWNFKTGTNQIFASTESMMLGGFDSLLGATFFTHFDVFYNVQEGKIGIRPNPTCM